MIKVYLAARYTRRAEMEYFADLLKLLKVADFDVVSRWVYGAEEVVGISREEICALDLEDIDRADAVISFTEPRGSFTPSGGRHVEFGYGLALGKVMINIGEWENVFHHHPRVYHYDDFGHFVDQIPNIAFKPRIVTLNQYQEAALTSKLSMPLYYPALKLSGEAGEVAEKIGKIYRDKNGEVTMDDRQELVKELGDVAWYLSSMADELFTDLEHVANVNIDKLSSRVKRGVLQGSGDNR